jgi:hypothetical protein
MPSVTFQGGDIGFEWADITPRLGLTYALGAERKTLLRASYSRFADQLGTGTGSILNTSGAPGYTYFYTDGTTAGNLGIGNIQDLDGDGQITLNDNVGTSVLVDPRNQGLLQSFAVDPDLEAPLTDEVLFSVEHALLPEFVIGVNLTYRKIHNLLEAERLVFEGNPFAGANLNTVGRVHTRADYVLNTASTRNVTLCTNDPCTTTTVQAVPFVRPDGTPYTAQFYTLRPGLFTRGGSFLENGDREQEYQGASLVFNKRLANRWMLRGNVTWSDWEWSKVPDSELEDPTDTLGGNLEGEPVLQGSGPGSGSKGGIYINSEWAYSINGLYQIAPDRPWGFNVALNLNGRQGYPVPYWHRFVVGDNPNGRVVAVEVTDGPDEFRNDDVHMVDARVEKEFTFSDFGLTLGVDLFNAFNEGYVLQRQHRLGIGTSDHVTEITSPRVLRIGARLSFR